MSKGVVEKKVKVEKGKGKNIGEGDEWENGKKRRGISAPALVL